jgi:hypothetical protein
VVVVAVVAVEALTQTLLVVALVLPLVRQEVEL